MPTRHGLYFHLAQTVLIKTNLVGMERRIVKDKSTSSGLENQDASGISLSVEENEMVFYILKELDLFLESEEAILKKELTTLDATFDSKISLNDKKLDKDIRIKEVNGLIDSSGNTHVENSTEESNDGETKKDLETGERLKALEGIIGPSENGEKKSTDGVVEDEDEEDDDDDDGTLDGSFGMPMADACAECFHTEIKSALANSVRNSHVACLQAILEQLFQTREVAQKKRQRNIKRLAALNQTKSGESHVYECNQDEGVTDSTEPNLSASPLLLQAITRGHSQVVHLILKCLEDLNQLHDSLLISESTGKRPIHLAAYLNHTSCLDLLLQKTPVKRVYWRDKHGRTPLLVAAAGGAVQCLKRLLTTDDVGATSNTGANAGRLKRLKVI